KSRELVRDCCPLWVPRLTFGDAKGAARESHAYETSTDQIFQVLNPGFRFGVCKHPRKNNHMEQREHGVWFVRRPTARKQSRLPQEACGKARPGPVVAWLKVLRSNPAISRSYVPTCGVADSAFFFAVSRAGQSPEFIGLTLAHVIAI